MSCPICGKKYKKRLSPYLLSLVPSAVSFLIVQWLFFSDKLWQVMNAQHLFFSIKDGAACLLFLIGVGWTGYLMNKVPFEGA
jgi:hypothetical protein